MKHIADIQPGGFIVDNEYHKTIGEMLKQRDESILALVGDKAILSGVVVTGSNATDGIVTFNGKIYRFVPGVTAVNVTTKRIAIDRPNASQIDSPAFYEDVIEFGSDGFDTFPFADLTRVKNLQEIITDANLVNVAPAWAAITGKPTFVSKILKGKLIIGDVAGATVSSSGDITSASIIEASGPDMRIRVNFNSIGITDYIPTIVVDSKNASYNEDNEVILSIKSRTTTSFDILVREVISASQNIDVLIQIIY
tara:strand:+ start:1958 stop:2716 length:759 start_codon:yes stop_codon:yes gene_type:complete